MVEQQAEQKERMQKVEERKRKERELKKSEQELKREKEKQDYKQHILDIRAHCESQTVPHTEKDLKSAKRKFEDLAAMMTDDDFVVMRKKLVGYPKAFEQDEFRAFFASPTVPLELSMSEISALGTAACVPVHRFIC